MTVASGFASERPAGDPVERVSEPARTAVRGDEADADAARRPWRPGSASASTAQMRIGITTYLESSRPGIVTSALEFASPNAIAISLHSRFCNTPSR